MSKWIPDTYLDLVLAKVDESDGESLCTQQPTTYFQAAKGDVWSGTTAVSLGDVIRPGTPNGYVYECVTAGTTAASEPGWSTTQDAEFTDGTVTWKTHANYCVAHTSLAPTDVVVSDNADTGRKATIAEKIGVVTHVAGTVTHTALITDATNTLNLVTTSETTLGGSNDVEAGRTTIFFAFTVHINDPV